MIRKILTDYGVRAWLIVFGGGLILSSALIFGLWPAIARNPVPAWQHWAAWILIVTAGVIILQNALSRLLSPLERFYLWSDQVIAGNYQIETGLYSHGPLWNKLASSYEQMCQALSDREKELEQAYRQMESVLNGMAEGVLAVDSTGAVIMINDEAKEMLGVEHFDIVGRQLGELVRIPEMSQAVSNASQSKRSISDEFTTARPPRRILKLLASPLVEGNEQTHQDGKDLPAEKTGNPAGVTVVLQDITEIKHLENMRRDFVANVSHELKTPLTAIKAYAETLKLGAINDPENCVGFVAQIEQQADRLHDLIIDLIRLAQIESGEKVFEFKSIDLVTICRSSWQTLQEQAASRKIELFFQSPDDQVLARGDGDGFRAIADNLLSNAIRYTPENGKVWIRCYKDADFGVIEVQDSGLGIAAEHQERIFERFYRVDKARSRDVGGTGLGLSIVKHLTQSFHGTINLQSEVGEGSTFKVMLPLLKEAPISTIDKKTRK